MGMITKIIDENGFKGTIHVLTCDSTGKKLANILIAKKNEDLDNPIFCEVVAISPFADNANSGTHRIGGLLSIGPISKQDSPRFSTIIEDIEFTSENNVDKAIIKVLKDN